MFNIIITDSKAMLNIFSHHCSFLSDIFSAACFFFREISARSIQIHEIIPCRFWAVSVPWNLKSEISRANKSWKWCLWNDTNAIKSSDEGSTSNCIFRLCWVKVNHAYISIWLYRFVFPSHHIWDLLHWHRLLILRLCKERHRWFWRLGEAWASWVLFS